MIYFDQSATTQPYPEVISSYSEAAGRFFANPASLHPLGTEAEQVTEQAKEKIARQFNLENYDILSVSGATEANNMVLQGAAQMYKNRGDHIVTTVLEHASVYETAKRLESEGFRVTFVSPDDDGTISAEKVINEITDQTILVSVIHVSHELGTILPVEEIGRKMKDYPKARFHVDHVQGACKLPINIEKAGIDYVSLSPHKLHGLKGSGLLFKRKSALLKPQMNGGGQQGANRPGTENTAGLAAAAKALRISEENRGAYVNDIRRLNEYLSSELAKIPGVEINSPQNRSPFILNVSVPGMKAEAIVQSLAKKDIYISTKSACSSNDIHAPSRILAEAGFEHKRASSALRLSMSYKNSMDEVCEVIQAMNRVVSEMKEVKNS
ncbi:cysteine desulfurase family protein [Salisediminibacterium halotolerans]|uniref:Cysteine desulfurase n=1 Tax=Salisediminibacterium halotolerans TaxID=517425 RepID=A0A1H9V686_9BACI|nr:cysteine desulfurase family protein [Salisediminibacterium haloalkalitolerans]SES17360.1 cysteine desulfurase [Salisediminibacterium haloalkalitolerans]